MGFDAYENAVEIAREMRELVDTIRQSDQDLAKQARRATQSIGLNIAEARKRSAGDRRRQFEIALGSAGEARAALEQADAWGYVPTERAKPVLERLDREIAMLWRLSGR